MQSTELKKYNAQTFIIVYIKWRMLQSIAPYHYNTHLYSHQQLYHYRDCPHWSKHFDQQLTVVESNHQWCNWGRLKEREESFINKGQNVTVLRQTSIYIRRKTELVLLWRQRHSNGDVQSPFIVAIHKDPSFLNIPMRQTAYKTRLSGGPITSLADVACEVKWMKTDYNANPQSTIQNGGMQLIILCRNI